MSILNLVRQVAGMPRINDDSKVFAIRLLTTYPDRADYIMNRTRDYDHWHPSNSDTAIKAFQNLEAEERQWKSEGR